MAVFIPSIALDLSLAFDSLIIAGCLLLSTFAFFFSTDFFSMDFQVCILFIFLVIRFDDFYWRVIGLFVTEGNLLLDDEDFGGASGTGPTTSSSSFVTSG